MKNEVYLGDGLYASSDGFQIKLRTPRGNSDHEIYLDPHVLQMFFEFISESKSLDIKISRKKEDQDVV